MLVWSAFLAGSMGASSASADVSISSPAKFEDDFSGALASDHERLFVAVTGQSRSNGVQTQVFIRAGDAWRMASPRFPSTNLSATDMLLLKLPGKRRTTPCVSYTTRKSLGQIRCRQGNKWRFLSMARPLRQMNFIEATSVGGRLKVLFSDFSALSAKPITTTIAIGTLKGRRVVQSSAPGTFKGHYFMALGLRTSNARTDLTDVVLADLERRRFVVTLGRGGWHRSKSFPNFAPGYPGSQFAPVRTRERLLVPVHTIDFDAPWTFSIYGRRTNGGWTELGSKPLNVGTGNPQGAIGAVGNRVWAVWEEYGKEGTDEPTDIYAAQVNKAGSDIERTIPLWSGDSDLPGMYDAVKYEGEPVFLYSRTFGENQHSFATVNLSHE